ncbi:DUF2207 domain-containing protein [Salmonella enterica]|nr:DUF2207 domain-containing protein [Salmonella enterica]
MKQLNVKTPMTTIKTIKKTYKRVDRKVERALSHFFDPLAEKVGGAANLVLTIMLTILAVFTSIIIFFGDLHTIFCSVTILVIFVLASIILTRNEFKTKNPWWYRER